MALAAGVCGAAAGLVGVDWGVARSIAAPASVVTSIRPEPVDELLTGGLLGVIGPVICAPVAGEGSATRLGRAITSPPRRLVSADTPL
ncbi:hypothetical protein MBELCI_3527 [Limimaricola cinnabarinus LL-001]|uniref:Uncharacterized protein n=1 Tax=Limimaricola cinnabarinus LL-001 TaxID=1337093 RepID=U2Z7Q0_9RHOB|nr:hypothetical protein MBELCI_3527 [Limimaricola cinnabarinus LL-001]